MVQPAVHDPLRQVGSRPIADAPFYHHELASSGSGEASSVLPAGRVDGRATAAVVHLAPLVIAFPPLSLLVNLAAQRDRRPLVRQAVRDVRRFDLVIVALVAVVLVLLLTDHATGFAVGLLTVTAAVFVVSHVIGAVQALRGRDFTYPLPPRLPRHRAPA